MNDIQSASELRRLIQSAPDEVIVAYFKLKRERDQLKEENAQLKADLDAIFKAENGG